MSSYILAIDQGTTSSRAMLFRDDFEVAAIAQEEFAQHYPSSGWVEHDPEDIWRTVVSTARAALAKAGAGPADIAGIGISNQRETVVVWERATGRPIHNAIVWQDRRTAELAQHLARAGHETTVARKTGLLLDPYFSATKIAWILDRVPGARQRAERGELAFGTINSFLLWRLTGGRVHATDATNASRTCLLDIHTGTWDDELLGIFGVPRAMLPEVRDNAAEFGLTDPALFGAPIPIRGMAGDQQAALIGQACFAPGMIKSTYGTGCFAVLNTGAQAVPSRHRLLTTIAYQLGGRRTYALEGSIFVAGAAVQWLRDGIKVVPSAGASGAMAQAADPAQDVILVPAFVGLGAPYWDPGCRGALFGLTRNTGANEFAKAALEFGVLPDLGPAAGHARGLAGAGTDGRARRRRDDGLRLDHAAARRHSRRARRSPDDPGDHGSRRRIPRRAAGWRLPGAGQVRSPLGARSPVHARPRRGRARARAQPLARRRAPHALTSAMTCRRR